MADTSTDRIATIDVLRGVAVCGILLMNITAFAMPQAAYTNPAAWGGADGANLWTWAINFVLVDGKMRGLFSLLFGASMMLIAERAVAAGLSAERIHYARMFWLLVIGLAHLWLVWWGDILHHYALIGAIAFPLRHLATRSKLMIALTLLVLQSAMMFSVAGAARQAETLIAAHPDDAKARKTIDQFNLGFGIPPRAAMEKDVRLHRQGYGAILADRWRHEAKTPIQELLFVGMETLAYMLMGMVCLSSGLLTGAWSARRYTLVWLGCWAVTVPAYAALAFWIVQAHFSLSTVAFAGLALTTPLRPIMIVGWACLIVLLARGGGWLARRFGAAGRMAFSNYLASSLICTTLFYGYGLGWYGSVDRAGLMIVVAGVWALMLLWSVPWLARFRYGPAEWLWRSLARGGAQPLRLAAA